MSTKSSVKAARVMKPKPRDILNTIGIDAICNMIEHEDMSYAAIAAHLGLATMTFVSWIDVDATRAARAKEARIRSARICDQLALDALHAIDDSGSPAQIARQREIASHYRWRAKSRNPREYGDRVAVDADIKVQQSIDDVDAQIATLLAKQIHK